MNKSADIENARMRASHRHRADAATGSGTGDETDSQTGSGNTQAADAEVEDVEEISEEDDVLALLTARSMPQSSTVQSEASFAPDVKVTRTQSVSLSCVYQPRLTTLLWKRARRKKALVIRRPSILLQPQLPNY